MTGDEYIKSHVLKDEDYAKHNPTARKSCDNFHKNETAKKLVSKFIECSSFMGPIYFDYGSKTKIENNLL